MSTTTQHRHGASTSEEALSQARARVDLYLRLLKVSAARRESLVNEVMAEVLSRQGARFPLTVLAMDALQRKLLKSPMGLPAVNAYALMRLTLSLDEQGYTPENLRALRGSPAFKRAPMAVAYLERRWLARTGHRIEAYVRAVKMALARSRRHPKLAQL